VIHTFGDQRTRDVFHGQATREVKRLDTALVKATVRKLDMIVAATSVLDLRAPPGNRLETRSNSPRRGLVDAGRRRGMLGKMTLFPSWGRKPPTEKL
jgi:plasmid maintenance system killer protein